MIEVSRRFDGFELVDEPTVVRVDGPDIAAIGSAGDFPADADEVRRFQDATILPGLIDTHLHLEQRGLEDRNENHRQFLEDRAEGRLATVARAHAAALVATGVTTVRDCGSTLELVHERGTWSRDLSGDEVLPRMLACGPPLTTLGGQLWWIGEIAQGPDAVRRATSRLLHQGVDAIKVMGSGGFATPGSDPFRAQYSVAELTAIVETARSHGRRTVVHAQAAAAVLAAAAAGADSIDHANWFLPDGADGWSDRAAAEVVASQASIGFTASGRLRGLLGEPDGGVEIQRLGTRHRDLARMGARIGVHSDAGASRTSFEGFVDSLQVAAMGLRRTSLEVLRIVTSEAASELGLDDITGSLRAGLAADLLVVDGDPTRDLAALRTPRLVMRGGRTLQPATLMHGGVS